MARTTEKIAFVGQLPIVFEKSKFERAAQGRPMNLKKGIKVDR